MASSSHGLRVGLQILLAVIIVVLAYFLYRSITDPWKVVEQEKKMTELTRQRMGDVRTALIYYERANDRYPFTLDSLTTYVSQDSLLTVAADSIFSPSYMLDSLMYSPRTGKAFEYAVNDTAQVKIYRLKDPDSEDVIGSLEPDPTKLNAASWE